MLLAPSVDVDAHFPDEGVKTERAGRRGNEECLLAQLDGDVASPAKEGEELAQKSRVAKTDMHECQRARSIV